MLTRGLKNIARSAACQRRTLASSVASSPSEFELCHAPCPPANSPGPLYARLGKQAVGVTVGAIRQQRRWLKSIFSNTSIVDRPRAWAYEFDDKDITVSTNPKCGTNLLLQTMFQIAWLGKGASLLNL